jgi:hypothetical protein
MRGQSPCLGAPAATTPLRAGCLLKPTYRTHQIDSRGCQDVLEMRLGQTSIAGLAQVTPASALGDGALHASA